MRTAIEFDRVSKLYRGVRTRNSLRDDLARGAASLLRLQPARERSVVRALEDVSFTIAEGESTALIGHNGAGKTTALKLATRITYPTSGTVRVRGRVGALLEVGTGMHPDLTGRENVHLYGRILGLSSVDITRRFDEIVEFAGVEAAIDQPVKQYSSGMQLRLGFSVAAHLEPDVLVVDEAIAVGDAAFKYRCVERMAQLVNEGRTLVFVTHEMSAVEALCTRAILIRNGHVVLDGPARDVITHYFHTVESERIELEHRLAEGAADDTGDLEEPVQIIRTSIHDESGCEVDVVRSGRPMTIRLHYRTRAPLRRPSINLGITDTRIGCLTLASMSRDGGSPDLLDGEGSIDCTFADLPLLPRVYEIWCGIRGEVNYGAAFPWRRLRLFRVEGADHDVPEATVGVSENRTSPPVLLPYSWEFRNGNG